MPDHNYHGIILEDKWGKTYLCSNCLFAYADLGQGTITDVKDKIFARYFLHDLEPAIEQRSIWAKMYQQARPTQFNLSRFNNLQLRDQVVDILSNEEMWVWPLSDGWGQPPEHNGIGDGGLAPDSGSASNKAPVNKPASKPQGGAVVAADNAPTKAAEHEAKLSSSKEKSLVDMPNDLIKDSSGIYGYMPTANSQFHSSKWPVDWSNTLQVEKARAVRLTYHEGLDTKLLLINKMKMDGVSESEIAKIIVDSRNKDRLSHYKSKETLEAVHNRNLKKYGNKNGPTYESQLDKYGSDSEIINAALRSNDTMDILTGISKPRGIK